MSSTISLGEWLDLIKPGFAHLYCEAFREGGYQDLNDIKHDLQHLTATPVHLHALLEPAAAKPPHIRRIVGAVNELARLNPTNLNQPTLAANELALAELSAR
jgi:hypothetical protein